MTQDRTTENYNWILRSFPDIEPKDALIAAIELQKAEALEEIADQLGEFFNKAQNRGIDVKLSGSDLYEAKSIRIKSNS